MSAINPTLLISETEIKELTDIAANVDIKVFKQNIQPAQLRYIKPLIGKTCYEDLLTAIENDNATALQQVLLDEYIKKSLAWWVYSMSIYALYARITPTGIQTKSSGDMEAVDTEVLHSLRKQAQANAQQYDELMVLYLEDNASNFPCFDTFSQDSDDIRRGNSSTSGISIDFDPNYNNRYFKDCD